MNVKACQQSKKTKASFEEPSQSDIGAKLEIKTVNKIK